MTVQWRPPTAVILPRLTTAKASKSKLPQKELADMMADRLKNQHDFRDCSLRIGLYEQLRDTGFGTPQLGEWAHSVSEQANLPPG